MAATEPEQRLVEQAISGDRAALEELLHASHDRLVAAIRGKLPPEVRDRFGVEDICQEAYIAAFRQIGRFKLQGDDAFFRWLLKIAERKLLDARRRDVATKRGAGRPKLRNQSPGAASSVVDLLELLAVYERTPSSSAASHEAIAAQHRAVEFRRAGAIRHNLFDNSLGPEKAVDVMLATDLIVLREIYDIAVMVSGDQDYVPAVKKVKDFGRSVVNVAFKRRDGRLLPGGARRLNQVTDWSVSVSYEDFARHLGM